MIEVVGAEKCKFGGIKHALVIEAVLHEAAEEDQELFDGEWRVSQGKKHDKQIGGKFVIRHSTKTNACEVVVQPSDLAAVEYQLHPPRGLDPKEVVALLQPWNGWSGPEPVNGHALDRVSVRALEIDAALRQATVIRKQLHDATQRVQIIEAEYAKAMEIVERCEKDLGPLQKRVESLTTKLKACDHIEQALAMLAGVQCEEGVQP